MAALLSSSVLGSICEDFLRPAGAERRLGCGSRHGRCCNDADHGIFGGPETRPCLRQRLRNCRRRFLCRLCSRWALTVLAISLVRLFLQRALAMAERCRHISYDRFRLFVCLSITVRRHVKMTQATITWSSLEDSPCMTLVSSRLTWRRNSKGNIGSGAPNDRAVAKIGSFSQ